MTFTSFEGEFIRLLADVVVQRSHFHTNNHCAKKNNKKKNRSSTVSSSSYFCVEFLYLFSNVAFSPTTSFPFLFFFSGVHSCTLIHLGGKKQTNTISMLA